jgi:hypothetical protein
MLIEHFVAIGSVEAFDEGVLVRLAWLDVLDRDTVLLRPLREGLAEELGTVVVRSTCGNP